ncbi:MAG: hypothetical protein M1834_004704 [Cirrosporium novae-zelandiae]|nr:MAG: hypothetical protein M1834_004704 [Cirrosporium novae-zelandiae]
MSTSAAYFASRSYDYVIVGGGTAGLVLANRLTEDPSVHVAVLEAGQNKNDDRRVLTPAFAGQNVFNPEYDWCFMTTPQPHLDNRPVAWPRGRLLGGSSATNFLVLTYPSVRDIDNWAILGNPGWSFKDLQPFYQKFQTFHPPSACTSKFISPEYLDKGLQGTDGPLSASFAEYNSPVIKAWPETFKTLKYTITGDPMSGKALGGHISPSTIDPKTATRSHAGVAYYKPVASRPNLHLLTDVMVSKVLFSDKKDSNGDIIATGVQIISKNEEFTISASKEVLICAGTVQSSQILELSGIGAPSLLSSHNIPVLIANENVGENLQDHLLVPYQAELIPEPAFDKDANFDPSTPLVSFDALRDPEALKTALKQYETSHTGPLGHYWNCSAYIPCVDFVPESMKPKLAALIEKSLYPSNEPQPLSEGAKQQRELHRNLLLDDNEATAQFLMIPASMGVPSIATPTDRSFLTILACLTNPLSIGSIHITSPSVTDYPAIDPNYLSNPIDVEILSRHVQYLDTIMATSPLAQYVKKDGMRIPPLSPVDKNGKSGAKFADYKAAEAYTRAYCSTEFHPIGTCSMRPRDKGGVVSPELKVYGAKNLRVVDASVIPMMVRGNILSSVYAVAEKAADIIKKLWALNGLEDKLANGRLE